MFDELAGCEDSFDRLFPNELPDAGYSSSIVGNDAEFSMGSMLGDSAGCKDSFDRFLLNDFSLFEDCL